MDTPIPLPLAVLTAVFFLYFRWRRLSTQPLPPGPRGLPVIGSLWDIVTDKDDKPRHLKYLDLGKNVCGDHLVVLNSAKATDELLEKRSINYSDRPVMRYSDKWKAHRRIFNQYFKQQAVVSYYPVHRKGVLVFLNKILNNPESLNAHARDYAGAMILQITYGITSEEEKAYFVQVADLANQSFIAGVNHGSFMVDYFPFLKHIPYRFFVIDLQVAWFPGAGFKQKAAVWAKHVSDMNHNPWRLLKSSMANGTAMPSVATNGLERLNSDQEEMEPFIQHVCAVAYGAGADTTVALLLASLLALVRNPEVQTRAQAEIDEVVGSSRLPDFQDRDKLPYIDAILKETQRLYPALPLSIDHCSMDDDIYEGYFIPKGTTVIGNAWAILHDEKTYPEPMKFKPERFLKEEGKSTPPDSALYAFGFGRRICPGRFLALDAAWLMVACVLSVFDINKTFDAEGNEIEVVFEHSPGAINLKKAKKGLGSPANFGLMSNSSEIPGLIENVPGGLAILT
ncbi:cytochrome P450 [Dendrothele bispora CBS 962.96]|uniref:Cytochrome P450 n=1 Tax=Dendrothele bispora (strain CBS 962.96) TaxID=1314807 RepID=A0A4S8MBX0_DENBC|nr:cytochrome P450 [Dendrothele bispora CBS 962.96]